MARLSKGTLVRLVRILGMLGSEHDGERAAAGLAATRLVRDLGLTWWDVLDGVTQAPRPVAERWVDAFHDPLRAAESRMRQLRRENADLRAEVARLKRFLDARNQAVRRHGH